MNNDSTAPDNKGRELATTSQGELNTLSSLDITTETGMARAEFLMKKLITSEKSGIKRVEDGISVLMRAQELNLPFSTCIEHIHVINGKTGIDVHIIKSLLSRAGVTWECVKDYTPQYQYTDGNTIYLDTQLPEYCVRCKTAKEAEEKSVDGNIGVYPLAYYQDLKGNVYNEFQISDKCVKCINKVQANAVAKEGKFPVMRVPAQPIDFVTEYRFTRYRVTHGKLIETHATSHFSYTEAVNADMFTKDTYKKYPRVMIGHRAFALGARDIADDLLMGCLESSELGIVEDTTILTPDYYEEIKE